jgi:hypothetical protein
MTTLRWLLLIGLAGIGACGKRAPDTGKTSDAPQMGAMPMGNMAMDMKSMPMMGMMQAHMDSIAGMSPQQMGAIMAAHQGLASRMLDAMGADMMAMHTAPDSAWSALSDSVRRDLADLPGLSGRALKARMEAHAQRMRRLMAMHQAMMKR